MAALATRSVHEKIVASASGGMSFRAARVQMHGKATHEMMMILPISSISARWKRVALALSGSPAAMR